MRPASMDLLLRGAICVAFAVQPAAGSTAPFPTVSIRDAVEMTRIQRSSTPDGKVAAISPDQRRAAVVTWHGDIARNVNVYELRIIELGQQRPMRTVLTQEFSGDPEDQSATPFAHLAFLPDNRTLSMLCRTSEESAQVCTVDTSTGKLKQLTHHPSAVRAFAMGPRGDLLAYSALATEPSGGESRLRTDGVFLWDHSVFHGDLNFIAAAPVLLKAQRLHHRQYFRLVAGVPQLFFDSRRSKPAVPVDPNDPSPPGNLVEDGTLSGWSTMTADPTGRYLLLFPYYVTEHPAQPERFKFYNGENAYVRRIAAPYGLVDLTTGRIEVLIDAPHPQFAEGEGPPVWDSDGRAVTVFSLDPHTTDAPPQWMKVTLESRQLARLKSAPHAAASSRTPRIDIAEAVDRAPELSIGKKIVSNLNPQFRERRFGAVGTFRWPSVGNTEGEGFLIKPVGYDSSKRYPLVVLLDDGTLSHRESPFLIDAVDQLSGHAIQPLSGAGIIVLYPREPRLGNIMTTREEGPVMQAHIEGSIDALERRGLIDPARIGISGWSRAGYYTNFLLIHSKVRFAAATTVDGGGLEYNDYFRPFTDSELSQVRTPLLFEPHGLASLVLQGAMVDRLRALRKPTEILYFDTASHSTTRPQHRARSLGTHVDWWRFWLQDYEDPAPDKSEQYVHWRRLRAN